MPLLPPHFPLPLTRFFARLQAAGFPLDPAREWQLREVLHERGADYVGRFGDLKYLLAPYLVKSGGEQRRFYRLWEEWLEELEAEAALPDKHGTPESEKANLLPRERPWHYRWRRWILALVLLPLLFGIGLSLQQHFLVKDVEEKIRVGFEAPVGQIWREGDTVFFENWYAHPFSRTDDSIRYEWIVTDARLRDTLHATADMNLTYVLPPGSGRELRVKLTGYGKRVDADNQTFVYSGTVQCGYPPALADLRLPVRNIQVGQLVNYAVTPEKDVNYEWDFGGETRAGPQVQYVFKAEGSVPVTLRASRAGDPDNCFALVTQQASIGHDRAVFPPIQLRRDPPVELRRLKGWVYLMGLIPLLLSIPLWRQWRRRRRKKTLVNKTEEQLAEEYPIHDAGPYNVPYVNRNGQISVPADFYRIADQLRMRESGLRRVFDERATVEATIREGGFPAWRDRAVKRPADFLLLLEHHDEFHQQQQLLERLAIFLIDREANLTVYYHNGHFDHFWNAEQPAGINPTLLAARYRESRLLIAGDAHGLVDPYESARPRLLADRVRWLQKFHKRALLTTEPVADWSFQEVLLHEQLPVYPMTTAGIRDGVRALNEVEDYDAGSYPRWETRQARQYPEPAYRYRQWRTVGDHRDYLAADPELFRWLCGLAVSSTTDWNLTIATGRALGVTVTHDRLLILSRIPWLARNAWDHDLRLALLAELSNEDRTLARNAVVEELTAVQGLVVNSFAKTEWTANHAVQLFCLQPGIPAHKQRIRDLRQSGWLSTDQLNEMNRSVTGTTGSGADGKHEELSEWLDNEPKGAWITTDLLSAVFLCFLTGLCLFSALTFEASDRILDGPLPFYEYAEVLPDLGRDYLNRAVSTWEGEPLREELQNGDEPRGGQSDSLRELVRSLLDTAILIREENYPLARKNQLLLDYEKYRLPLNEYAYDRIDYEGVQDSFVLGLSRELYGSGLVLLEDGLADAPFRINVADFGHLFGVANIYDYQYWKTRSGFTTEREQFLYDSTNLAEIERVYLEVDSLGGERYFDSIATLMPVNLRTLLVGERRDIDRIDQEQRIPLPASYTLFANPVTPEGKPANGVTIQLYEGSRLISTVETENGRVVFYQLNPTTDYILRADPGRLEQVYRYDDRVGALGEITIRGLADPSVPTELSVDPPVLYFDPLNTELYVPQFGDAMNRLWSAYEAKLQRLSKQLNDYSKVYPEILKGRDGVSSLLKEGEREYVDIPRQEFGAFINNLLSALREGTEITVTLQATAVHPDATTDIDQLAREYTNAFTDQLKFANPAMERYFDSGQISVAVLPPRRGSQLLDRDNIDRNVLDRVPGMQEIVNLIDYARDNYVTAVVSSR